MIKDKAWESYKESERLAWDEYSERKVRAGSGWFYLYPGLEAEAQVFGESGGIYIYTDRRRFLENRFKVGQTIRGEQRVFEQGADQDEDMIIVGFVPMDITGLGKYDEHIHGVLEDTFDCKVVSKETARGNTEWIEFPTDEDGVVADPVSTVRQAIQLDQADTSIGRKTVELSYSQAKSLEFTLTQMASGSEVLLEELAPRFGKTIWALALFAHRPEQVMVVSSYVLSALSSYRKEVTTWNQFSDMVVCDSQEELEWALEQGYKVVIPVSLHNDYDMWLNRYRWVTKIKADNKFVFVDEADFGAHTERQIQKVEKLVA